ncbi:MAG: membrane protein insertion efficiency factor YidD [Candidatus Sabulitectum sp.]|nr:membrane protein insertion efficiency factor YidD [Candidatus Sabulitectum sp.]
MSGLLIGMVRLYRRTVSPFLPPSCIYTPTCSAYAEEALKRHGAVKGLVFSVKRILRCHPWHSGGYDPVPEVEKDE